VLPIALPIAITQGDPAGIGPEIVAKAFRDAPDLSRGCFAVGDLATLRRAARCIVAPGEPILPVAQLTSLDEGQRLPSRCLPVWPLAELNGPAPYGMVSGKAGQDAAACVVWAARAALHGEIAALVTAPLHKEALSMAGVPFPGHTELLQAGAARPGGVDVRRMPGRLMLANDELRTVLVSIHVALREAIAAVTHENVLQTLLITHEALGRMLGRAPRIAVAGLNPHAGEGGCSAAKKSMSSPPPSPRRVRGVSMPMVPSRPTRSSCVRAQAPGARASSTSWWPCTTTRG